MPANRPNGSLRFAAALRLALAAGIAAVAGAADAVAAHATRGGLAQTAVSVRVAPPPMPWYEQPAIPGANAIWAPGFWAWDDWWGDFYWVPGAWVTPPRAGLLWTPGWWGFAAGRYVWHAGYWAAHVGWYGGINYGYGYNGYGYDGGEWRGGRFFYNNAVTNVRAPGLATVYSRPVTVAPRMIVNSTRVSYGGGPGGAIGRPTASQRAAMRAAHLPPVAQQIAAMRAAQADRSAYASVNFGRPPLPAGPRAIPSGALYPGDLARPGPGGGEPSPALTAALPRIDGRAPGGPAGLRPAPDAAPEGAMAPPHP